MEEEAIVDQEVHLSDLLEVRDRILAQWRLSRTAENKKRLSEFSERLVRAIHKELLEPYRAYVESMQLELEETRQRLEAAEQNAKRFERQYRRGAVDQRTGRRR